MDAKRIVDRIDSLISMGEKVLATHNFDGFETWVDVSLFQQWRTSSLAFLDAVLTSGSIHYRDFDERCRREEYSEANRGLAILRSAKEDITGGYFQKVETLVSAEVFNDFLEMAEHLLDNGYKDPAASLIGAVLEDSLRRMCANNTLPVKSDDNISSLNQKLAQKPVYNRLQQREIEAWNKLRDYADHGYFNEYDDEKVRDLLENVRKFLDDYLK